MVIKPEELTHIQESRELKVEYVFFDKTDQPRTRTGKGVTEGILMLTNNQLAFFSNRRGKSSILGRVGIELAKGVANNFTFGLASLAEYGIEKGIGHWKDKPMDFISSAQKDESFVVSTRRIVSCEKFGGRFSLNPKKRYVKVGILDDYGIKRSYCIYSVNPKDTQQAIHYEEWFNIINEATRAINLGSPHIRSV